MKQKGKKETIIKRNEAKLRDLWGNVICPNIRTIGVQELENISFHSNPKERQ